MIKYAETVNPDLANQIRKLAEELAMKNKAKDGADKISSMTELMNGYKTELESQINTLSEIEESNTDFFEGLVDNESRLSFSQIMSEIKTYYIATTNYLSSETNVNETAYIYIPTIQTAIRTLPLRFTSFMEAYNEAITASDEINITPSNPFLPKTSHKEQITREALDFLNKYKNNLSDLPPNNFGVR